MRAEDIKNVSVIGSGMIGSGWAICFAMNGLNVILYDIKQEALDWAKKHIEDSCQTLEDCGVLTPESKQALFDRIAYTLDIKEALDHPDYIQECVPESFEIKRGTVAKIEELAPPTALVGSSCSRMRISDMVTDEVVHKERYIIAHPFNPPHLVPAVELSKGPGTSQETEDTVYAFFKRLKKEPVVLKKESIGHAGNLIQAAIGREINDLIGRGIIDWENANRLLNYGPGFRHSVMGTTLLADAGSAAGVAGLRKMGNTSGLRLDTQLANWVYPNPNSKNVPHEVDVIESLRKALLPPEAAESREATRIYRDTLLIHQLQDHKLI